MRELPAPLAPFGAFKQFMLYRATPSTDRPGKTDKFPVDFRTGAVVSAHDAQFWTDHATAIAYAVHYGAPYGVAFVFTENDPFWFLDIDDCRTGNEWSPIAQQLCNTFPGAAIEVSQSGSGLHIFGTGRPPEHGCKNKSLNLEFYNSGRFVALTGTNAIGNASIDFTSTLAVVAPYYFPPPQYVEGMVDGDLFDVWEHYCKAGVSADWRGPADDADLIRRALRSQSVAAAFGGRASFADLWTANSEALGRAYPDAKRAYDASSADAALAQHLAFWTGKDCARIERLMRQSALVRDKYERRDYLPRTILGAYGRQVDVLADKLPEPVAGIAPATDDAPTMQPMEGGNFIGLEKQQNFFKGCVWIRDLDKVMIPGGIMLKQSQFKTAFGGRTFTMDAANEKVSRDAWEAFTQNQVYSCPKADAPAFRPAMPAAAIFSDGGINFVNTYWPVEVPRQVGDPSPFLTHLRKVLPNEQDANMLLYYMAACVQHKGTKFQWAPVIIGTEGNGKTLFTRCVAEAVGRRYVHWPKASQLTNKFNSWMLGRVFFGVEDIFVSDNRAEVMDELKPMITGENLEIEGKGVDQFTGDICGNFMLNSNHLDAIRKTLNDRRFAIFYTAQLSAADLARDGMTGNYFKELYGWLKSGGYAIVSELLHTLPIPDEFNPAIGCQRAPVTSTTHAAIRNSAGGVEQEITEAIEQGKPGFCGGWISSIMLDRLLTDLGAARKLTLNKRRDMLAAMGYVPHPALTDGRANSMVLPDGGKPRLYVLPHAPAARIATARDAEREYESANNVSHAAAAAFGRR